MRHTLGGRSDHGVDEPAPTTAPAGLTLPTSMRSVIAGLERFFTQSAWENIRISRPGRARTRAIATRQSAAPAVLGAVDLPQGGRDGCELRGPLDEQEALTFPLGGRLNARCVVSGRGGADVA
jgi:hypothetical protein